MKTTFLFFILLISVNSFAQNRQWVSRPTWVSNLPDSERMRLLEKRPPLGGNVDYSQVYSTSRSYEALDWRNVNGVNWLLPASNQGRCGSCVAFGVMGTLEGQFTITSKMPWLKPRFSTQSLFACMNGKCDGGLNIESTVSYVVRTGVVDSSCAPYTMGTDQISECRQFCPNQNQRTFKIAKNVRSVNGVSQIKEALKKGPVLTRMDVYEDFFSYAGGIYKSESSTYKGGHAITIVGFNDQERYWILRNSWGPSWGEDGFFRVSWDDKSGIGLKAYQFDTHPVQSAAEVISPAEGSIVFGEINVQVGSSIDPNISLKLMKDGKEILALHPQATRNAGFNALLNTLSLEDGKYELIVVTPNRGGVFSVPRGFFIKNTANRGR